MKKLLIGAAVALVPLTLLLFAIAAVVSITSPQLAGGSEAAAQVPAAPIAAITCPGVDPELPAKWSEPEQLANAAVIVKVGQDMRVPERGWLIAVATAMQESRLINVNYGDRDSLGLFQQRPSQGWGTPAQVRDPIYASGKFYAALLRVGGWQAMPLTEAAQAVQRSGFPLAYAKHETTAARILTHVLGRAPQCATPATGPWTMPMDTYRVSSRFQGGFRFNGGHSGLDLAAPTGTVVRAASAGVVYSAAWGGAYGNLVKVRHAGGVETWYAHLSAFTVRSGPVQAGAPIAVSGNTGNTTGPHLHFEVRLAGLPVDPEAWLSKHGVKP